MMHDSSASVPMYVHGDRDSASFLSIVTSFTEATTKNVTRAPDLQLILPAETFY